MAPGGGGWGQNSATAARPLPGVSTGSQGGDVTEEELTVWAGSGELCVYLAVVMNIWSFFTSFLRKVFCFEGQRYAIEELALGRQLSICKGSTM